MATHKSAEKRNRQSQKKNTRNSRLKSEMRTAVKAARNALASGAKDKDAAVKTAVTEIYRAASKNVLRSGTASRYVSRLMKAASKG
ncbi:MAG: 30S ribosomal protein S20 [Myxococcota bacterium]